MRDYSNYHNTDMNAKIAHDGNVIFEYGLNGFDGYDITVNGTISKALITSKYSNSDGTEKNIVGKIADIERGNVILINETNENWLVASLPTDNKVYRKAVIKFCNSLFPLPGETTRTQVGTSPFGEPFYEYVEGEPISLPCIAETSIPSDKTDEAINLPLGSILITIPYTEHEKIAINQEFDMYSSKYKIVGIDYTKTMDKVGLLILNGEKV